MTVIYLNAPAVGAPVHDHPIVGCENQIIFRADQWGTTQVQVDSFSASDPGQKLWQKFVAASNLDWCLDCISPGQILRFSVINPDPITQNLFVEILDQNCCCGTSEGPCLDLGIRPYICE